MESITQEVKHLVKNKSIKVVEYIYLIDMFDNLSFLSIQGVKTPCFKIFILLNSKFV